MDKPMFSYNFKDDVIYMDDVSNTSNRNNAYNRKTLYSELTKDIQGNIPQYSLEAYNTSNRYNLKLQYPNNFVVPMYHNHLAISALGNMLNKDTEKDYAVIIERFIINTSLDAANLLEYYSTGNLRGIANTKENADMCRYIRSRIMIDSYPIEIKVMHLIDLSKLKGLKSVYLPNLNLQLHIGDMSRSDVHPLKHYIGDYAPKSAIKQKGIVQAIFRIVDNSNPGKTYYTKMFGEVYAVKSVEARMERDSIKITLLSDDLEIDSKVIYNLSNMSKIGFYTSKVECENSDSIDKVIEIKKLELEFEKLNTSRHKNILEHSSFIQKHKLEMSRIKFEYSKLEVDTFKNLVDLKNISYKIKELNSNKENNKKNNTPNANIANAKGVIDIATGGLKLFLSVVNLF